MRRRGTFIRRPWATPAPPLRTLDAMEMTVDRYCYECEKVTESVACTRKMSWKRPKELAFECRECGNWRWAVGFDEESVKP